MNPDEFPATENDVEVIEPETLKARIDAGEEVDLLDVRASAEYEEWHIDGETVASTNVPYVEFLGDDIDDRVLAEIPADRPVTVVCAKGRASAYVAGRLAGRGYDVDNLEAGMNGWARLYEAVPVTRYDGPGQLRQYQRPSSGCLGYFFYHDGEAAVIDPLQTFTDRYLADAERLGVDLRYAVDTHIHADHVSGVRELAAEGVEGVVPAAAVDRGVTYADEVTTVADGETLVVGNTTVEAVHTPGHTTGMTAYLVGDRFLATGDGLFVDSVARPDLEAGDGEAPAAARTLHDSLQRRVLALPGETLVGGAHVGGATDPAEDGTYTAPIADLVAEMDALTAGEEEFVELVLSDMPPRPANHEEIIATNLGQHAVGEAEAFRLELGPNNCAASRDSLAGD